MFNFIIGLLQLYTGLVVYDRDGIWRRREGILWRGRSKWVLWNYMLCMWIGGVGIGRMGKVGLGVDWGLLTGIIGI